MDDSLNSKIDELEHVQSLDKSTSVKKPKISLKLREMLIL